MMAFFHSFCESTKLSISHAHNTERNFFSYLPSHEKAYNNWLEVRVVSSQFCYKKLDIHVVYCAHFQGEAKILALELNCC